MKKIEVIIIGLILIMATAFSVGSAQTETTYYCYNNGEWRVCTPSEVILAEEAMTREIPRSLSQDEMKTLLSSHEPFWDYYYSDDDMTATPTLTQVPTPEPSETETTYYCYSNGEWRTCTPSEAILAREAMTREIPRSLSRDEMKALLSSHEPFRDYYTSYDDMTPTPTPTLVPAARPTPVPTGFWESIVKNRLPARNYTLPFKWFH
jgi:hypothetical protein